MSPRFAGRRLGGIRCAFYLAYSQGAFYLLDRIGKTEPWTGDYVVTARKSSECNARG
jgi:hypothetical protein